LQGHRGGVLSVAYSPTGARIVSSSIDIWIWDAVSGAPIGELQGYFGWTRSVAYSPDGAHIISGHQDGGIQVWDAVLRAPISEPLQRHTSPVCSVAFFPDGIRVASGSADGTVRIWDAASRAPIGKPLQGHSETAISVACSPDGTRIVSASFDRTIRIWDASPELAIGLPQHGSLILTETGLQRANASDGTPIFPNNVMFHSDGWLTTSDGELLFWVPPEQRRSMFLHPALVIIGAEPLRINLDRFEHGARWILCRTGVS
jgi:WD40 repeat protein